MYTIGPSVVLEGKLIDTRGHLLDENKDTGRKETSRIVQIMAIYQNHCMSHIQRHPCIAVVDPYHRFMLYTFTCIIETLLQVSTTNSVRTSKISTPKKGPGRSPLLSLIQDKTCRTVSAASITIAGASSQRILRVPHARDALLSRTIRGFIFAWDSSHELSGPHIRGGLYESPECHIRGSLIPDVFLKPRLRRRSPRNPPSWWFL